jgi:hypothetical protein
MRAGIWIGLALLAAVGGAAPTSFEFAGIGLDSDLDAVARRYPGSQRVGDYLHVASREVRDHITGIGISGAGPTRRVRLGFEKTTDEGPPLYPVCADVERRLTRDYGPPGAIREFDEEAMRRMDRVWSNEFEELVLMCFKDASGRVRAEGVTITPRSKSK